MRKATPEHKGSGLPTLQVTPESLAAFCATQEFEFLLAALLFESQSSRKTLENARPDDVASIATSQGKVQAINRMLADDFPSLLIKICEDETEKDGGRGIAFALKVFRYTEALLRGS